MDKEMLVKALKTLEDNPCPEHGHEFLDLCRHCLETVMCDGSGHKIQHCHCWNDE